MLTIVTSNGRISIPKAIRDYLGLETGDAVVFKWLPTGEIALRSINIKARSPGNAIARGRARATVRMTTEEIMALTRGK